MLTCVELTAPEATKHDLIRDYLHIHNQHNWCHKIYENVFLLSFLYAEVKLDWLSIFYSAFATSYTQMSGLTLALYYTIITELSSDC